MKELIKDPVFWAAIGAVGTLCAALGAGIALWVARSQLAQMSSAAGSEALFSLYALFDNEENRDCRRLIWKEIAHKEPKDLSDAEWDVIEQTATAMDLVGTILKHRLIKSELVFERYAEVILPLWTAMDRHVQYRRNAKGRFGWTNFEWLVHSCQGWSLTVRKTAKYRRF